MSSAPRHICPQRIREAFILMALLLCVTLGAMAQQPDKRRVTPVTPPTNRTLPPPRGTNEQVIQQYITGDSTAAMQQARKDSLRRAYKRYPLLTDVTVGINLAEPLFMILGQSYASADVNATLNLWNRVQPTIELGLGWARNTPEGMNFTYRGKPSPYVKVGANYNFMFKNSPDYQALVGLRVGYSNMAFDITDMRYGNSYWQEMLQGDIRGLHSHALWGEAALGLKVKLLRHIAMGWMVRYHGIFNYGKSEHARPWFIPGYGPRNSSLGFSLSILYTLPLARAATTADHGGTMPQQP